MSFFMIKAKNRTEEINFMIQLKILLARHFKSKIKYLLITIKSVRNSKDSFQPNLLVELVKM